MLFAMKEVGGLDAICAQPAHEETTPDLVEAILQEAAHYAAGVLDPLNRPGDVQGARWHDGEVTPADGFREAWSSFCENGWVGMPALHRVGRSGTAHAGVHRRSGDVEVVQPGLQPVPDAHARCRRGDRPPRQRCAQAALSGAHGRGPLDRHHESHRAAGRIRSGALRSRAVPEGDHYRVSGNKIFITWGEHDMAENIVHLVLARLPDAPPG